MRIGVTLGTLLESNDLLRCARIADTRNIESIWIPESWGRDAFVTLGYLASITKHTLLGTGIVGIYSRTAAAMAMAISTLDTISDGRAILGLGASSKAIVENWHGMRFEKNVKRMKEYVEAIRAICTGEKVNYQGRFTNVNNFKLGFKPRRREIPIYIAAVNERMLRLAMSIGNGVMLFLYPREEIKRVMNIANKPDVASVIITAVSKDSEEARLRAKKTLAFYAAVGRIYAEFLASHGFEDEISNIQEEYRKNGLANIHNLVSDNMLDSIAIAGSPEECKKRLEQFLDTGINLPIIHFNPVRDAERSFIETLDAIGV